MGGRVNLTGHGMSGHAEEPDWKADESGTPMPRSDPACPRRPTRNSIDLAMTWGQGSNIPKRIKDQVRRRDRVCQLAYPCCTGMIEQFDHVEGLADQGLQRTTVRNATSIQGVCRACHHVKTKQQQAAGRARAIARRGGLSKNRRDLEPHPGLGPAITP
jgi:hypothetical protein